MELEQLYQLLELPETVIRELEAYEANGKNSLDGQIEKMLLSRETWDEGVKALQELIGNDSNGMKILCEMLHLACVSYKEYEKKKIPLEIYIDTMKFCTRFIEEYHRVYGQYKFVWAWWFPRQLALQEFRIGALEYEFVEGEENIISVHIPSDANLQKSVVIQSFYTFFDFRKRFFTEWTNAKIYCESWLLSPVLKELLDDKSNIIEFQKCFIVESTDYESLAVMDWVFPGEKNISEQLSENTSLQRKMKKYLLQGRKIGWSRGYLNEAYINS